jgi:YegS/Rv2252/BmrU family lipid kinase
MHTCAIVNPTAGGGRVRRHWPPLLADLLAATNRLTVRWTTGPGSGTALTRQALRRGVDRVVAIGGDGTLHHVVNGFFEDGTPLAPSAACAFVACGTGSDARHALGVPQGRAGISHFCSAPVRPVDLLRLQYTTANGATDTRYALNVASLGLSGAVVRWAQRGRTLPIPPRLRYFSAILAAVCTHRPSAVALTLNGRPLPADRAWAVAVANGSTFGAGLPIAPAAQIDDGHLDVTIVHAQPIPRLLRHAPHFYRGTHGALDGVTTHRGRTLTARPSTSSPVWLEADGEVIGRLPATVDLLPGALRIQA